MRLATIDANGLQVPDTILKVFEAVSKAYIRAYNLPEDTIFNPNDPDGQVINNLALICYEYYQNLLSSYNANDLDSAIGVDLDRLVSLIGGIRRKGGQFTLQDVTITVDRTITLNGLDGNYANLEGVGYTVQDNVGQKFVLISSITLNAGSHTLPFRASEYGSILTSPNTITEAIDIVAGVININNSTSQSTVGNDEEVDSALRARSRKAQSTPSLSILEGLESSIQNIDNVTDVIVYDNDTGNMDVNGTPPNTIWVIVEGGIDTDIAKQIFIKKTPGIGTRGAVSVEVSTSDNRVKNIKFDRPLLQNLYIKFNIKRFNPGQNFNINAIKEYITSSLTYSIGALAETASLVNVAINAIANTSGGGHPLSLQISNNGTTWSTADFLETTTKQHKFILAKSNIIITILP